MKFQPGDLVEATWYDIPGRRRIRGPAIVLQRAHLRGTSFISVWVVALQVEKIVNKRCISSIIMVRQEKQNEV